MADVTDVPDRWLPVVGYEGLYEVSDQGQVWSVARVYSRQGQRDAFHKPKMMKIRFIKGYGTVPLTHPGEFSKGKRVHRLVLEAFVGPCPPGMWGLHGPGGSTDNRLENLYWGTPLRNAQDKVRDGTEYRNTTHCRFWHRLVAPNLVEGAALKGELRCWSCVSAKMRTWKAAKIGMVIDSRAEADRLYLLKMSGTWRAREPLSTSFRTFTD